MTICSDAHQLCESPNAELNGSRSQLSYLDSLCLARLMALLRPVHEHAERAGAKFTAKALLSVNLVNLVNLRAHCLCAGQFARQPIGPRL